MFLSPFTEDLFLVLSVCRTVRRARARCISDQPLCREQRCSFGIIRPDVTSIFTCSNQQQLFFAFIITCIVNANANALVL
ncbi:Dickkopf N-terminal cysteine-rich domain-containing protein [Ohtaekwangia kribbensis]|uniref:Dickkopf N-terminal cysteine-rich domain-containing protein n=1 Tax=Ohtaekwangia kribbensis TaxID=688913 RepID=A0ABW3K076_9BACT